MSRMIVGLRTFVFGLLCLVALGAPLGVLVWKAQAPTMNPEVIKALAALYGAYCSAVGGVMIGVAAKHGVESLATGGGLGGLWKTLTTAAKPGEPPAPGTQP